MQIRHIFEHLQKDLSSVFFELHEDSPSHGGDPFILVPAMSLLPVCDILKDMQRYDFQCLSNLTAVDFQDHLRLIYHLFSYTHHHSLTLTTSLLPPHYEIDSVSRLWPIANWFEREVFDMFGIQFRGHPSLKHLLLPQHWTGYPLRKDYERMAR